MTFPNPVELRNTANSFHENQARNWINKEISKINKLIEKKAQLGSFTIILRYPWLMSVDTWKQIRYQLQKLLPDGYTVSGSGNENIWISW